MPPRATLKWMLTVLLTGVMASGSPVRGQMGQNIMLPCRYRVDRVSDITSMCWGRGSCPSSQCSQLILWTDGWRVTERQSSRYQLRGNVAQGDVSLTIVNAAEADEGLYCCRVEIPGWFNDEKHHLEVVIERGVPKAITPTWLSISSSESPQATWEPESRGPGMYRNIIGLSLLGLLVLALCIFTCYFCKTQKLENVANSSTRWDVRDQNLPFLYTNGTESQCDCAEWGPPITSHKRDSGFT